MMNSARRSRARSPSTDFPEVQFLGEAHKVVVAQVGDVSAPDSSKEKVGLHIADVTEEVRQKGVSHDL